jgi:NAD(P)-dependent dehydrogenase (short-subunit alcohol dehydrogenase family)
MERNWNTSLMPSLVGKRALVTGANSGIGYYTALELARAGAEVVLAVRNLEEGRRARAQMQEQLPAAKIMVDELDSSAVRISSR